MDRLDAFVAGFVAAGVFAAAMLLLAGSPAERAVDREAYGWLRYTAGVTEGARQATLKCPYNYRMKP